MSKRLGTRKIHRGAAIVAALVLAGGLAACADQERVSSPSWSGPAATPDGLEYTPERATARGVRGWVLVQCRVAPGLAARDCIALAESPQGGGSPTPPFG